MTCYCSARANRGGNLSAKKLQRSDFFLAAVERARNLMGEDAWVKTTKSECAEAIERELQILYDQAIAQEQPPDCEGDIKTVQSRYQGVIDGITDGSLYGWCCLIGSSNPVEIELFADDRSIKRVYAQEFRLDLQKAGFGTGKHGFFIDIGKLGLMPNAVLRVKVVTDGIELANSGRRLGTYGTSFSAPAR
jgi:hypothetical protein